MKHKLNRRDYAWVLGYVDAYGAIHSKLIRIGQGLCMHGHFWPGVTHKLWRFNPNGWSFEPTRQCETQMDEEDTDRVLDRIKSHFDPPEWALPLKEIQSFRTPNGKRKLATKKKRYVVLGDQIVEEKYSNEYWSRGTRWELSECRYVKYL